MIYLKRNSFGTDRGLSVVKNIGEAHKGKVWIESEGRGTTFVVELGEEGGGGILL